MTHTPRRNPAVAAHDRNRQGALAVASDDAFGKRERYGRLRCKKIALSSSFSLFYFCASFRKLKKLKRTLGSTADLAASTGNMLIRPPAVVFAVFWF
ncbi:hypothetical protein MTO96_004414 [Rhipicephalus appendiculatus]